MALMQKVDGSENLGEEDCMCLFCFFVLNLRLLRQMGPSEFGWEVSKVWPQIVHVSQD